MLRMENDLAPFFRKVFNLDFRLYNKYFFEKNSYIRLIRHGDFEIVLEMNNDFGPDSGLFLRSDEQGTCYQAMIDYHGGGNLMGIYGESALSASIESAGVQWTILTPSLSTARSLPA